MHVFQGPGSGAHGNNQARPWGSHVFSTGSKGTAMQKPGNDAKAFGSSRQVVHKHGELNVFRKTWYSSPDLVIEQIEKSGTSQTRACMIAPMCAYKCEHVHAYVWVYVSKGLRKGVHILAGTITPMCAYTWANDSTHVYIFLQAWLRPCVHIGAVMIMPYVCIYACRHDHAYVCIFVQAWSRLCVCIYVQAWSRLCVHICAGMITPTCAYSCRHDCAYLARGLVGVKILRANKTKPNVINVKGLTLCKCIRVHTCWWDTQTSCLTQRKAKGFCVHGNNQARPCTSHAFSTASSRKQQCRKPGNNAKAFGSSRQVVAQINSWELKG